MSNQTAPQQGYRFSIYEREDQPGPLVFTFTPKGLQQVRGDGGAPRRVPEYIVTVREQGDRVTVDWGGSPDDPGAAKGVLEQEAVGRAKSRRAWVELVVNLVARVEDWARQLGWATRRIEKKLDDTEIGKHRVPALLMQEGTCRVMLEPVGRSAPGAEGIVDLYLMPAYDDIASLYFHDGQWNLHYVPPDAQPVGNIRETVGVPLSKEALATVLEAMQRDAA
jgi:hypothetical protein